MKELIEFANDDSKVRVVMVNGSRLNVNAPRDMMQDYDAVFFVEELENISYKTNELWWIQTYVVKEIWRDELPLVKYMYDVILNESKG